MRQFTLLLLLTFLSLCYSFADNTEEPLYFISAKQFYDPYVYYDDDEYENAYLFSLQNGNLDTLQHLSSYVDRVENIDYYVDLSTIVITTQQKYGKYSLSILNTKSFETWNIPHPIYKESPKKYINYNIIVEDDSTYLAIHCSGLNYWEYTKHNELIKMSPSQMINLHCTIETSELIIYDSIRDCFTLPIIPIEKEEDKLKRPILPYKIDRRDYQHKGEITGLDFKNSTYSLILNSFTEKSENYIVYQHKNDKYNIITIPGNTLYANIWGDWLGGAETYDGNDVYNYIQKPNATLYLYNIPQNRMIQWNSKSNNAAILHIENNEVYYRINDTLYKASILEDSIGEPEVIWQSDILKNVHWLWK
jgi:hypothetical protein